MSSSKLIVVVGATGNQGGSVVDTFLSEVGWKVRAVTRNTSSSKARVLQARGAELVQADLDEPESLVRAFDEANVAFVVSDFWGIYGDPTNKLKALAGQPMNVYAGERETQQLKNAIDAAATIPTLQKFVLSSLSNVTKWSKGKYTHVYHFDSKAQAEDYGAREYPDLWKKTSIYQAGIFINNFISGTSLTPYKNADGVYQFAGKLDLDVKLPFIAAEEDTGPIVKAIIETPARKNVIGYRAWLSIREFVAIFSQATGFKAEAVRVPDETEVALPPELKEELEENFAFFNEFGYEGRDDPTVVHPKDLETSPELDTVASYMKKHDWAGMLQSKTN